ncbi:acyl-CoA carboxylase epsilon subunit [Streptomyces sclerotialus]|uniref:acyl-CoA carboxylase epsilon subunit n=1 Tax=Streptomyces sclerotialus TaxID=1957 RepID=UPI000D142108
MSGGTTEEAALCALFRIERGSADDHELAALAVVLLARVRARDSAQGALFGSAGTSGSSESAGSAGAARWRAHGFTGARSWR